MATSDLWSRVSGSAPVGELRAEGQVRPLRASHGKARLWMALDALTVFVSAALATVIRTRMDPLASARAFYHNNLFQGYPMSSLLILMGGFSVTLIFASRRLNLYNPPALSNFLHEQRRSLQACLTAGLLLAGALYLLRAIRIPRSVVLMTVVLVAVLLSLRRLIYRILLYRRYERGLGTRHVMIVGTGPDAHALRHHIESIRHLGYTFKGFADLPRALADFDGETKDGHRALHQLFQNARASFVDEIIFTAPCSDALVQKALEQAGEYGVELRLVPNLHGGLVWNSPVEFIGQFPTIPLYRGNAPEIALLVKRAFDAAFSAAVLVLLAPLLIGIAIAIRLDSPGPVFYRSKRIGKRASVFRCLKFRTMVQNAEQLQTDIAHLNERDAVLFKIAKDPRITRVGRWLRKYSLDELPQFFNVLRGDMSIVGPRPPLVSEVQEYSPLQMRRLSVKPGITGMWQVHGRQDPSFDNYISLDIAYIENWSLWLDVTIMVRTIGVIVSGTGT